MQDTSTPISSCRHCRFYQPEGRRGGQCQQLNVTVQGAWQACGLVEPPFELVARQPEARVVQEVNVVPEVRVVTAITEAPAVLSRV